MRNLSLLLLSPLVYSCTNSNEEAFMELRRKEQQLLQVDYSAGPSLNIDNFQFCSELNEDNSCKNSLERVLKGSKIYIGVELGKYKLENSSLQTKLIFRKAESSLGDLSQGNVKEYGFVDLNASTELDEINFNPDLLVSYFDTSELSDGKYNVTLYVEELNTGLTAISRTSVEIYESDSMDVSMKLCKSVNSGKCEGEFTRISNAEEMIYPFAYIKYHHNDGQDYNLRGGMVLFFPNGRNVKRALRLQSIGEDNYLATTSLPIKGLTSGNYEVKVEIKSSKMFEVERRKEFQVFGF